MKEVEDDVVKCYLSSEDDEDFLLGNLTLGSSSTSGKSNSLIVSLIIEGIGVQLEVDSGACYTVMSLKQFVSLYGSNVTFKAVNRELKLIDGNFVNVKGYLIVQVKTTDTSRTYMTFR